LATFYHNNGVARDQVAISKTKS